MTAHMRIGGYDFPAGPDISAISAGSNRRLRGLAGSSVFFTVSWQSTLLLPLVLYAVLTISAHGALAASDRGATIASQVRISSKGISTKFSLKLSRPVGIEVFTLADPYRVIIDLPNVNFRFPKGTHGQGKGLIKAFRYGPFAPGKSRIVLDVGGPIVVRKSTVKPMKRQRGAILTVEFEQTDDIGFLLKPPPRRAAKRRIAMILQKLRGAKDKRRIRPVIVIDPGHGGVDAGTIGVSSVYEKNITIAVARRLSRILRRSKRYKVVLTRNSDIFVSLDDRVAISHKHGANLFISIHADAIANKEDARSVRGGTIYTLSESASDEQARRLAEKENAVDMLAGVETQLGEESSQVKTILIDLLRRETANFSTEFSNLLLEQFRGKIRLHSKTRKSAAFHVLKQPQVPSVLIELGYMSNAGDEKELKSAKWQNKLVKAVAKAIDRFFARQLARSR